MTLARKYSAQLLVLAAAGILFIGLGLAQAAEETSVLVNKPVPPQADSQSGPALPPPMNPKQNREAEVGAPADLAPPALLSNPEALPTPPQSVQSSSSATKQPFMRPAAPRGPARGKLVDQESSRIVVGAPPQEAPPQIAPPPNAAPPPPVPSQREINMRPAPPITYDTDHDARKMYRRSGEVKIVMATQDPADGCYYGIPLCIPACCVGEPNVSSDRGLLGRGKVEYCWPCGFRAIVKFRHTLGDVKVEYEGD
ncbi:MAG: hypothetical protein U0805_10820 [Pirellulales bacterium]